MTAILDQRRYLLGRDLLGPVFARYCLRLHLWALAAPEPDRAVILFAARGGLRLQFLYGIFRQRTEIAATGVPDAGVMISRIAVMRAFLARTRSAREELARYCNGKSVAQVLSILLGDCRPAEDQDRPQPVSADMLEELLREATPAGQALRDVVAEQECLLMNHLQMVTGGRDHILFVDTGLFGSTFRVLQDGLPDRKSATLLFGRCIYREAARSHLDRTFGLSFQADRFSATNLESVLIRHWYLVEAIMEPPIDSINVYQAGDCGNGLDQASDTASWARAISDRTNPFFRGIVDHFEAMQPEDLKQIDAKADRAAVLLASQILVPDSETIDLLHNFQVSTSPGEEAPVEVLLPVAGQSQSQRLSSIRRAKWKEGQIRRAFPRLASIALPVMAGLQLARSLKRGLV